MKLTENKIYMVLFTFIFSFIFMLVLTMVNSLTSEKIKTNEKLFKRRAVLKAMAVPFATDSETNSLYKSKIKEIEISRNPYFISQDGSGIYATIFTGNGLWGIISGVIAIDSAGETIVGIDIISHSETPGLGGRIEEDWYLKQFRGEKLKDGVIDIDLKSPGKGNYNPEDGTIDSITGASRTSEYLEDMINKSLRRLKTMKDKIDDQSH